jgi:hypothetical protein
MTGDHSIGSIAHELEPLNELEHSILRAQKGDVPISDLMQLFLGSQVFVLIDKEIGPSGKWDNSASSLVLRSPNGFPVLAIFTCPERATNWPKEHPQFCFGLLTDFSWLLKGIGLNVGIAVNPGSRIGFEMPPTGVNQLKSTHES